MYVMYAMYVMYVMYIMLELWFLQESWKCHIFWLLAPHERFGSAMERAARGAFDVTARNKIPISGGVSVVIHPLPAKIPGKFRIPTSGAHSHPHGS